MKTETKTTISEFIDHNQIRMSTQETDHNPNMANSDHMDHYRCTLLAGRSRMTIVFSKGSGHNGVWPTIPEVLDCLASDASSVDNAGSFEDWCADFGYSTDSRTAKKTFDVVERQARSLRKLLGDSAFETLLYSVERD